jgi:hypothetical protein
MRVLDWVAKEGKRHGCDVKHCDCCDSVDVLTEDDVDAVRIAHGKLA